MILGKKIVINLEYFEDSFTKVLHFSKINLSSYLKKKYPEITRKKYKSALNVKHEHFKPV